MKFTDLQRKTVSIIVLAAFLGLLGAWATPAPAATRAGNSETAIVQGESDGPNFIETENTKAPAIAKGKKFPWLIVGLGVVAIGVAVYFLVIKKTNYTLTVTLGAGCTGTPTATTSYEKGTVVSYNYTPATGYTNIQVMVDGVSVPDSGTITMDANKALTVTAETVDIRGIWYFTTTGLTSTNFNVQFAGTATSGTVTIPGFTNTGTYTVTGENVSITITGPITF
ncbi:MAG: hypothetical protein NTZ12_11085, partial [Candidatus Aminicenantes bacterium]|nr:hypothetical protein [Candidatus Aminicenantes bacterium]